MSLTKDTVYSLNQIINIKNSLNKYDNDDFVYISKTGKNNEYVIISSKDKTSVTCITAPSIKLLPLTQEKQQIFNNLPISTYLKHKKGDVVKFKESQILQDITFEKDTRITIINPKIPFCIQIMNPNNKIEIYTFKLYNPCELNIEDATSLIEEKLQDYTLSRFKSLGNGHDSEIYTGSLKKGTKKVLSFSDDGWGGSMAIDESDGDDFNEFKKNIMDVISSTKYAKKYNTTPYEAIELFISYLKDKFCNHQSFKEYVDTSV